MLKAIQYLDSLIFCATKFGLPEVTREHDISYHELDNDPLCVSSKQLTDFYDAVNPVDDKHPQRLNDIDVLNSKIKTTNPKNGTNRINN